MLLSSQSFYKSWYFTFRTLLNEPEAFLTGYIPSMPLDAVESLGAMVGAAAFVCPKVSYNLAIWCILYFTLCLIVFV